MIQELSFANSATAEIALTHEDPVWCRAPALATGTTQLLFEASVDGGITWDPVYDDTGTQFSVPVSDSAPSRVQFSPDKMMRLGLWRLRAVDGSGVDVLQTATVYVGMRSFGA